MRLFQKGDYAGARRLFKQADAAHHAPQTLYNIGLAEERLSHPQAAVDAYEAYVAEVGDKGDLTPAAAIAIAQIKSRSTRLRIDTKPSGARVFVDGTALAEPSPTTYLVPAGHHVVVAQGDSWRGEVDLEVSGTGDVLPVVVKAQPADVPRAAEPTTPPPVVPPPPPPNAAGPAASATDPGGAPIAPPSASTAPAVPNGFVWGAAFALAPYHMLGAEPGQPNTRPSTQVVAGAILEAGHAVTDRFEFVGRGFVALGPDDAPSYAVMGGPGISLRVGSSLWLGATFIGGRMETRSHGQRYGTGWVFGAMSEITLVITSTESGQWAVGAQPGLLLTDNAPDNTAFFFPLTFGYRAY